MDQSDLVFEMGLAFPDLLKSFVEHGQLDHRRGLYRRIRVKRKRLAAGEILGVDGNPAVVGSDDRAEFVLEGRVILCS